MKIKIAGLVLTFVCLSANLIAGDGITPTGGKPAPTPTPEINRAASTPDTNEVFSEVPGFWDFLTYFFG